MEKFSITVRRVEKSLCYVSLALMALLPVIDAILTPLITNGVIHPPPRNLTINYFTIRFFMLSCLLAAMLTTKAKDHIAIAVVQYLKNEKIKNAILLGTNIISTFTATVLFWDSLSFLKYGFTGRSSGLFSESFFTLIMPIAFGVIAVRFAGILFHNTVLAAGKDEKTKKPLWMYIIPALVLIIASAAALPAISKIIWGFQPPEPFFTWVNNQYDAAHLLKAPLIILLILAGLAGTPIFTIIGCIALVMLQAAGAEPDTVPIQIYSAITDSDIIAIPLFTLTGFFLSESKAGERLVATFRSLFSWLPGGMIIAAVVICAFFTSFTGASGVTILALGGILFTILKEKLGYDEKFTIGLLTSVGCIGLLFPPSLPIILVGSTTNSILFFMEEPSNYSIIDFFLGGIIPGIILVVIMIVFGIAASIKIKIPVTPFRPKEAGAAIKNSILEILLPFFLLAGYFSGFLTLIQISAVSVIYVFIVEVLINRDIAFKNIPKVLYKAVPIIGGILAILAMAKALSYAFIDTEAPMRFAAWMHNTVKSKYVFLLILNIALLVLGSVMDIFSAILIVLPLLVPLGLAYGINPIHMGVIFIANLEVGFLTPPVGINLFLASYRFKKPFIQVCRYVLPFVAVQLVVVFLITYIPWLSTFLVDLFK